MKIASRTPPSGLIVNSYSIATPTRRPWSLAKCYKKSYSDPKVQAGNAPPWFGETSVVIYADGISVTLKIPP